MKKKYSKGVISVRGHYDNDGEYNFFRDREKRLPTLRPKWLIKDIDIVGLFCGWRFLLEVCRYC